MIETLLNAIIYIPGPTFLLYFIGLSTICIKLGWLWANADGSTQHPLPEPTRFDPIAIAALRNGTNSVIRTVIFSLWNNKMIDFKGEGKDTTVESMQSHQEARLGTIEKEIYNFVKTPRKISDLFQDSDLKQNVEMHLRPIYEKLENSHLVRTELDRSRTWKAITLTAFVITGVGVTKLYFGIKYGHPVLFLIILLIISLIALYIALKPGAIPSRLGRLYLKELEGHFGWLKEDTYNPKGIDPAFAIAIFGIGALSASPIYNPFNKAFPASKSGGGCGGGCGGGGGDGGEGGGCGGCGGCGG